MRHDRYVSPARNVSCVCVCVGALAQTGRVSSEGAPKRSGRSLPASRSRGMGRLPPAQSNMSKLKSIGTAACLVDSRALRVSGLYFSLKLLEDCGYSLKYSALVISVAFSVSSSALHSLGTKLLTVKRKWRWGSPWGDRGQLPLHPECHHHLATGSGR